MVFIAALLCTRFGGVVWSAPSNCHAARRAGEHSVKAQGENIYNMRCARAALTSLRIYSTWREKIIIRIHILLII